MRIALRIAVLFIVIALIAFVTYYRLKPVYEFPHEWDMIKTSENRTEINLISAGWKEESAGRYNDMYELKGFSTWSKDVEDGYVQLMINYDGNGVVTHKYMRYWGKYTGVYNRAHEIK